MSTQNRSARCKTVTEKPAKNKAIESSQGGGLQGPEKRGWSAASMEKYPGNVKPSSEKK